MILAIDNVGNGRQLYIINCMNVPKHLQLVQKNEKLLLWCAQVIKWCGGWVFQFCSEKCTKVTEKNCNTWLFNITMLNPLGSEADLGSWSSFDMPWHLCFFQLLINILMTKVSLHCIQQKLGYNNMWATSMYMFVFLRELHICVFFEKTKTKN